MRVGHLRGIVASFIVCLVALLVLSGIPGLGAAYTPAAETRQAELILKVGGQDEMKTLNPLPQIANDVWTSDVHYRAYHSILLGHWVLDKPMAYIAKGVDYDEDGMFDRSEYDVWAEQANPTTPLDITVYYDFNGVKWHDGVQMTQWDLLFSYHVNAQNARFNTDIRILFAGGTSSSYEAGGRQLNINITAKNWEGEGTIPGDPNLRVAVKFQLTESFALFYDSSLFPVMLPMHEWSRTGGLRSDNSQRHGDFGCAVWIPPAEATAKGIPACGNADPAKQGKGIASSETVTGSHPYYYNDADAWTMIDEDVIGNGPFEFESFIRGSESKVTRYEKYFVGVDPDNPSIVYDPILVQRLKKPTIEGIRYLVYKTTQLGVFALQSAEVDFYHWNVGAEFVPDLLKIPEIAVESNAEPGFFYMAYNLRRQPWGYLGGNPANGDLAMGYWLRQAFSHLIDKKSIVQNLLQNFGVIGHGTLSPANTFWYNDNIPKPEYDLTQAAAILDDMATAGGLIPQIPGFTLDPPGACSRDTPAGCRSMPTIGNAAFDILTPQADYDPVRASAGAMVADAMRRVGINAVSKPTAFGTITSLIAIRAFDLLIFDWRIDGWDPDYLFDFFHSSNAASGRNYPGFQNATFDQVIEDSRAELDRNARRSLIFQGQQILADARPYEVLYYRTNIEGYRQDRFVNWTVIGGTIWNYWSLQGIRPPSSPSLRASIAIASATSAGATEPVTVTVFDDSGGLVSDALVILSVDPGPGSGNLSIGGGPEMKTVSGTTDLDGKVYATYHAANVLSATIVLIQTATAHPAFPDSFARSALILVFPTGAQFLSIWIDLPLGNRVPQGFELPMNVTVEDQDGNTVPDATVDVYVDPPGGLMPNPSSGTAAQMSTVMLMADPAAGLGDYTVTTVADKVGFAQARSDVVVTVVTPSVYTIVVETVPSGLQVWVDGTSYTAPVSYWCLAGATVTLSTASSQGAGGILHRFSSWSGLGSQTTQTVSCDGNETYVANFTTEYEVSIDTVPEGLTVEVEGVAVTSPHSFWCPEGASRALYAPSLQGTDDTRHPFVAWSDGGARSHAIACDGPVNLTATFSTEYEIAFATAPPGLSVSVNGSPTQTPLATWCPSGSSVAVAADSPQTHEGTRYRFASWSDGGGIAHEIPCDGAEDVTATFVAEAPPQAGGPPYGTVAAILGAVAVASILAYFLWRRKRGRKREPSSDPPAT